jgi:hypothetical protein
MEFIVPGTDINRAINSDCWRRVYNTAGSIRPLLSPGRLTKTQNWKEKSQAKKKKKFVHDMLPFFIITLLGTDKP